MKIGRLMTHSFVFVCVYLCVYTSSVYSQDQRVAVLELKNKSKLKKDTVDYITQRVRGVIAEELGGHYVVLTKENILALVDEQICDEIGSANCEVEAGKILGSHYVVTGSVVRVGKTKRMVLKVHKTKTARLLGVRETSAKSTEKLVRKVKRVARQVSSLILDDTKGKGKGTRRSSSKDASFDEDLKRLMSEEDEEVKDEPSGLDDELERLEREQEERLEHEEEVGRKWTKVKRAVDRDPERGLKAIELFLKTYQSHKHGNPKSIEAVQLQESVRKQLIEKKRERLAKKHKVGVEKNWKKVKKIVKRGDKKGERALEFFLKRYADHPLGNPLEEEARRAFERAKERLEAEAEAAHRTRVERDWKKVKKITKRGGKAAIKAVKAFLKSYKRHDRGNPLEAQAQELLDDLENRGGSGGSSGGGRGKAGIKWVKIRGGSFMMGSKSGVGDDDERQRHKVRLKSFFISKTEVTVGQYRACVKAGKCSKPDTGYCNWGKSNREDHPINCIDWNQARTFAKWAGGDLCSESEWEYSARAGKNLKYGGSNDPNKVAWYDGNSGNSTHPVGKKKKNAWGLYDMSGNVWEWTLDEYKSSYSGAPANGLPVCSTPTCRQSSSRRVFRGGSWVSVARGLRVADRSGDTPDYHDYFLGARLCRTFP